jgi:hypothetical protein
VQSLATLVQLNCKVRYAHFTLGFKINAQFVTAAIYHAEFYASNSGNRISVPPPNFVIWLLINEKIKSK